MKAEFDNQLRVLKRALRNESFRFILIRHNRFSIYQDIAIWIRAQFPNRAVLELRIGEDPNYRQFIDTIKSFEHGILLIPDFQKLFRKENHDFRVAFNQRRDLLASLNIAFLCFVEPIGSLQIPKLLPDWWSLRSLELEFERNTLDIILPSEISTLQHPSVDSMTKRQKEAEIDLIKRQIALAKNYNHVLLVDLHNQLSSLYIGLSQYNNALDHLQISFEILQISGGDKRFESTLLNRMAGIYLLTSRYEESSELLQKSLLIKRELGDKKGESAVLNNLSSLYKDKGDIQSAIDALQSSYILRKEIGDTDGMAIALTNLAELNFIKNNIHQSLEYSYQAIAILEELGNNYGVGINFLNIGNIKSKSGEYEEALELYNKSIGIFTEGGFDGDLAITLENIARVKIIQQYYNEALTLTQQSIEIKKRIGNMSGYALSLNTLGIIYHLAFKDYLKSVSMFLEAAKIAKEYSLPLSSEVSKNLKRIEVEIGSVKYQDILGQLS